MLGLSPGPAAVWGDATARRLATAMRFPLFRINDMTLLKRMTLALRDGVIERVFYPVFPPDRNASEVAEWLRGAMTR